MSNNLAAADLFLGDTGADVPASYCPTDSDLTALEPGIGHETYYLPGGGAAFLLFGLLASVLSWK